MKGEEGFVKAIQANPKDASLRLVYADWLEERGDRRAEFLRLQLALKALSPDHLHWVPGEHELTYLRNEITQDWLEVVEPELFHRRENPTERHLCQCFDLCYEEQAWSDEGFHVEWSDLEFHKEPQDTECDAWKRLLDLVEKAVDDERSEFAPRREMDAKDWSQIVTLPSSIRKLKSVKHLLLYGSHLLRIPSEIGEMTSLEKFTPYTSYGLHWFPYEITRCKNLTNSTVSTRALYGNFKHRPPFPRLQHTTGSSGIATEQAGLSLKRWKAESTRSCSVCNQPFKDLRLHRVWISLPVATDVLPLLVNACSEGCIQRLPKPPNHYVAEPHNGGVEVNQPPPMW